MKSLSWIRSRLGRQALLFEKPLPSMPPHPNEKSPPLTSSPPSDTTSTSTAPSLQLNLPPPLLNPNLHNKSARLKTPNRSRSHAPKPRVPGRGRGGRRTYGVIFRRRLLTLVFLVPPIRSVPSIFLVSLLVLHAGLSYDPWLHVADRDADGCIGGVA